MWVTDRNRQNLGIVGQFSTVVALIAVAASIWQVAAGFTTATIQHQQLFHQNAEILQMIKQNQEEQLKVLRTIEEKLDQRRGK